MGMLPSLAAFHETWYLIHALEHSHTACADFNFQEPLAIVLMRLRLRLKYTCTWSKHIWHVSGTLWGMVTLKPEKLRAVWLCRKRSRSSTSKGT